MMHLQRKREIRGMKQVKNRSFTRMEDMEGNIFKKRWLFILVL